MSKNVIRYYWLQFFLLYLIIPSNAQFERTISYGVKTSVDFYSAKFNHNSLSQDHKIDNGLSYAGMFSYMPIEYFAFNMCYGRTWRSWGTDYKYVVLNPNDPLIPLKTQATFQYSNLHFGTDVFFIRKKYLMLSCGLGYTFSRLKTYREVKKYGGVNNFKNSADLYPFANKKGDFVHLKLGLHVAIYKGFYAELQPYYNVFFRPLDSKIFSTPPAQYGFSLSLYHKIKLNKADNLKQKNASEETQ